MGDNTYATILPRNMMPSNGDIIGTMRGPRLGNGSSVSTIGNGEIADYATLRNVSGHVHPPSTVIEKKKSIYNFLASNVIFLIFIPQTQLYEFTGSTFQALTQHDDGNYVAEII